MICDEMKRKFPPPLTSEEHVEAAAALAADIDGCVAHLQECTACYDAAETWRANTEDEVRVLLTIAVVNWWVQSIDVMLEHPKLPVM